MTLKQFSIDTCNALNKYADSFPEESMEAQLKFADIWDSSEMRIRELYRLPKLVLTGEGWQMGRALVTECIHTASMIRKIDKGEVYFFHNSQITLFKFLDKETVKLMQSKVADLIKRYNVYCLSTNINNICYPEK